MRQVYNDEFKGDCRESTSDGHKEVIYKNGFITFMKGKIDNVSEITLQHLNKYNINWIIKHKIDDENKVNKLTLSKIKKLRVFRAIEKVHLGKLKLTIKEIAKENKMYYTTVLCYSKIVKVLIYIKFFFFLA